MSTQIYWGQDEQKNRTNGVIMTGEHRVLPEVAEDLVPGRDAWGGLVVADVTWMPDGAHLKVAWKPQSTQGAPTPQELIYTHVLAEATVDVYRLPRTGRRTWVLGRRPDAYEAVYLPQQVIKHPRWRWPPHDIGLRAEGAYPDFTDGLMLGWLQALVREAWADPTRLWGGRVEVHQDHRELFFLRRPEHNERGGLVYQYLAGGRTEAAALINGLFAAPGTTEVVHAAR